MRISSTLQKGLPRLEGLFISTHKMPFRFRGKHRKIPDPKYYHVMQLKHDFEREQQNMLLLRHPYLTLEQSHGHMKEFSKYPELNAKEYADRVAKFSSTVTILDRLSHLRVKEEWD